MKPTDKAAMDAILKHKEYFDQRLIAIALSADTKIKSLEAKLSINNATIKELTSSLSISQRKLKDADSTISNLEILLASKKADLDEALRRIDELKKQIEEERKKNDKYINEINERIKRSDELEEELRQKIHKIRSSNSSNSNLSSSHDILSHTKAKAQANTRTKSNRTRGGQKGHELHKSSLHANPDRIIEKRVKKVPSGAIKMEGKDYYVTQEIDLVLETKITETRYFLDADGEDLNSRIISTYAINPVAYSNHFKASMVYLNQRGTIPFDRLCEMMKEISSNEINVRPSSLVAWNQEFSRKCGIYKREILDDILSSPLSHVDETGNKVNGKQEWIHTVTNNHGAYFIATTKRGDKENGPLALLKDYQGTLIHDHFKPYNKLTACKHAECNAHIDRYMKAGIEIDHSKECEEMLNLLHDMLRRKNELLSQNTNEMGIEEIAIYKAKFLEIAKRGIHTYYVEHPNDQGEYVPDYVATFRRMCTYVDDHLRFITDFMIPYTNNAAERQCRIVKTKKKISGQFVSSQGAKAYVDALTIIQTSRIRNENTLAALERVFD